jgi:succinate dehydrogenase/fumarate reductase flavoprotein subunit
VTEEPKDLSRQDSKHAPTKGETTVGTDKKEEKRIARRGFLKGAAIGAAGMAAGALSGCGSPEASGATPTPQVIEKEVIKEVVAKPWLPEKWDYEADIVILGFGFAGQAAAIEASDLGASVIVLDKAPREFVGGSSAANKTHDFSFIGPDVETNIKYVTAECWGTVDDPDTIRMQIEENHKLPQWFESLGGTVTWRRRAPTYPTIPGGKEMDCENNSFAVLPPQEYMDKFPVPDSGRSPFQEWMCDLIEARGIPLMCNTAGTELIQDGATGEILGVKALTDLEFTKDFKQLPGGKEIYVKANKGVILACGGYEVNQEMLTNFAPHPHSGFVTWYGCPFSTGDGVTMATKVGAKLWHMNKKECHSFACAPASKELGGAMNVYCWATQIGDQPGIIVNRDGKRFYNEYHFGGHSDQTRAWDEFTHKNEPDDDYTYCDYRNIPFYFIFDDTTMKNKQLGKNDRFVQIFNVYQWSKDNQAELEKGWIIKADTLEELAKKIVIKNFHGEVVGMDPQGLVETVARYNEFCAAGKDLDFGRRPDTLLPLATPPFYAMELCDSQTNTQGGPKHNGHCQVLDAYDKPIPRLYVAGELGSIFGHLYNGGENIPEASSGGRRAARHAVSLEPWDA